MHIILRAHLWIQRVLAATLTLFFRPSKKGLLLPFFLEYFFVRPKINFMQDTAVAFFTSTQLRDTREPSNKLFCVLPWEVHEHRRRTTLSVSFFWMDGVQKNLWRFCTWHKCKSRTSFASPRGPWRKHKFLFFSQNIIFQLKKVIMSSTWLVPHLQGNVSQIASLFPCDIWHCHSRE